MLGQLGRSVSQNQADSYRPQSQLIQQRLDNQPIADQGEYRTPIAAVVAEIAAIREPRHTSACEHLRPHASGQL